MLPSSFRDWANPELAPILRKTQRSPNFNSEERVKLLKAAWDAVGSEFGSRHTQYEMFYAGARFVTTGHSYRSKLDQGKPLPIYDLDEEILAPAAE